MNRSVESDKFHTVRIASVPELRRQLVVLERQKHSKKLETSCEFVFVMRSSSMGAMSYGPRQISLLGLRGKFTTA